MAHLLTPLLRPLSAPVIPHGNRGQKLDAHDGIRDLERAIGRCARVEGNARKLREIKRLSEEDGTGNISGIVVTGIS